MVFTKEQAEQRSNLLAQLAECVDEAQFAEIQKQLLELNKNQKQAKEERATNVANIFKNIADLEIDFNELMASKVYSVDVVKAYAQSQGWLSTVETTSTKEKKEKTTEEKAPLYIGVFQFADYGFTMPFKKDGKTLMGNGETELNWDFNRRYGGLSWQQKFINAIVSKGYEHILEKATPEFKSWLMEFRMGSGPAKDKEIHENKREFLKMFDIKPADADKIVFDFPTITNVVEEVRVVDEFSQEAPAEVEAVAQETETVAVEEEQTERKTMFGKKRK
ncbi:MAG: hypothetical protein PHW29_04495 [Flavobacterium sp.]|nr:hypothetical protein [Flavobacterium sp.]